VTVTNSVSSFVWLGGEFHRVLLFYQNSHLMNLPNDDHIYTEDIDTDGFHIDYINPQYPQYSVIDRCYFVTGKDDAIDHHHARLQISNCWLEDFIHEGVAASGGDTVKIFNTVAMRTDQGFENGWTEDGVSRGPMVFIDHCVAIDNNVGLRIGDSYNWSYRNFMKVTNSILYNNRDNIWNYLNSTQAPLEGALDISYSMTNDPDYDDSPFCITGVPQFDPYYYLLPGSPGANMGTRGTNMGRADSTTIHTGPVVINEIMYNAPSEMDSKDWIELYNPQTMSQDISGWIVKDNDNAHAFPIPSGTIMPAGGYWVLCADTSAFRQFYPEVKNISGNIPFGFGDKDQVRLFVPWGQLVDSVAYQNEAPWPNEADGKGFSLELLDPGRDHSLPENWAKSAQFGGSPGKANQPTGVERKPESHLPIQFVLEQNYPNPFNPRTRIGYVIPEPGKVRLAVFDILGRRVLTIMDGQYQPAGRYQVDLDGKDLPSGIYFYQVQFIDEKAEKQSQTKKMLLIK
ncbi:MAG: lamin tail domain-containing protein, partial [candidate division KSB1 bacterium]|nr:lamin tail domain-containing protein [candidate division KSB1 bacterium]